MPHGYVTTARGEILNMDELKMKATLPIADSKQPGREIQKQKVSKRKPLNVRGYLPAQGEAKAPELSAEVKKALESKIEKPTSKTIKASYPEDGEAKSLADITGIKVDKPSKFTRDKVKAAVENNQRPAEVAQDALSDILSNLEDGNPNAAKEANTKPTRRSRTKQD